MLGLLSCQRRAVLLPQLRLPAPHRQVLSRNTTVLCVRSASKVRPSFHPAFRHPSVRTFPSFPSQQQKSQRTTKIPQIKSVGPLIDWLLYLYLSVAVCHSVKHTLSYQSTITWNIQCGGGGGDLPSIHPCQLRLPLLLSNANIPAEKVSFWPLI